MEVEYDAGSIQQIYDQLQQRNAFSTGFADVADDYQKLLRQCRELKVTHKYSHSYSHWPGSHSAQAGAEWK
jgi:hypothetical protein